MEGPQQQQQAQQQQAQKEEMKRNILYQILSPEARERRMLLL
jgi:DNA-binding TFAR19-related protein (PDSD5 family)